MPAPLSAALSTVIAGRQPPSEAYSNEPMSQLEPQLRAILRARIKGEKTRGFVEPATIGQKMTLLFGPSALGGKSIELKAQELGIALTAERDLERLLQLILSTARELVNADAGSLYLIEELEGDRVLRFALAQNDSVPAAIITSASPTRMRSATACPNPYTAAGTPLPIGLPSVTMSGATPCVSNIQKCDPARPNPVCTSSAISSPPSTGAAIAEMISCPTPVAQSIGAAALITLIVVVSYNDIMRMFFGR